MPQLHSSEEDAGQTCVRRRVQTSAPCDRTVTSAEQSAATPRLKFTEGEGENGETIKNVMMELLLVFKSARRRLLDSDWLIGLN